MKNIGSFKLWVSVAIVVSVLALGVFGTTFSSLQTTSTIPNTGSMRGIGVGIYWDSSCTNRTYSISWGSLDPGSSKTATVYIRNEGNTAATLSKAVQNWNPSGASNYMTLSWNYSSQVLSANQVLQVRLTLTVLSTVSGITDFSFDLTITATG